MNALEHTPSAQQDRQTFGGSLDVVLERKKAHRDVQTKAQSIQ